MGATGISLSGGGIRSASFALGALQALQEHKGLLRGPESARWISAVSGGSYIAATLTLLNAGAQAKYCDGSPAGGRDLQPGRAPLEQGSPEVDHILRHCRYLVEDGGVRTSLRVILLLLVSFVTLGIGISWFGVIIVGGAALVGRGAWHVQLPPVGQWLVGLAGIVCFLLLFRGGRPKGKGKIILDIVGRLGLILLFFYSAPYLMDRLQETPPLRSYAWAWHHRQSILTVIAGIAGGSWLLNRVGEVPRLAPLRLAGVVVWATATWLAPLIVFVALVTWTAVPYYTLTVVPDPSHQQQVIWGIVFWGLLIGGLIVIPLPGMISPHRPYMEMLSRCFAVTRDSAASVVSVSRPGEIALSSLRPSTEDADNRYPELVICAAANVVDRGVALAGANCLPLIITGSTVGLPNNSGYEMSTSDLERIVGPQGWFSRLVRQLPVVSLMSSVAITGAAVSPAMGKVTRPRLRPLLAALNVRLGVWLPNPINPQARGYVEKHQSKWFGVGVDQLIWEFLGHYSAKNLVLYASDGGHYENLGIVQLIREHCSTIWCIDASGDLPGRVSALTDTILLAEAETGCKIDIDLSVFGRAAAPNRLLNCHASGSIMYGDNTVGLLHVVKLGLTENHSSILREYEYLDTGFPFHSTLRQAYTAERFQAYRRLGWESTNKLLASLGDGNDTAPAG